MKRWVVAAKKADFNTIAKKYGISPMLARIIRNRDIVTDEAINAFLNGDLSSMHDPKLLKDIDKAADRIMSTIITHERVRIIGDYDIDGICASFILKKSFTLMGIDADVRLPDRVLDGYGLNKNMINEAKADRIGLIVTCDNGIAASDEIAYAKSLGIDVVVTDHHEVPYEIREDIDCNEKHFIIPDAVAVVDPKQEDCLYPFKGICGGMVAYKLVVYITIQEAYSQYTTALSEDVMEEMLVFASIATIGDVMELLDENRIAVKVGLEAISRCSNTGLMALIQVSGLDKESISVYHVGFVLGPCINATGRLDTAKRALELLECTDYEKAVLLAKELKDLNDSRKNMTIMYAQEAIKTAESMNDPVLVIFLPKCHESLAGIVAGRVREKYYKPTIVLTRGTDGVKGSGRSIEDYNMFEELSRVKDIFTKFGGHKMAAGMSLSEDRIDELRRRLNENCTLTDEELTEKYVIDIPMPTGFATLDFAREIETLSPFGVGNPKPLFAQKDVPFDNLRIIGKNQNVLKMTLHTNDAGGNNLQLDGIMFGDAMEAYNSLNGRDTISILYQIDINSYLGRESVQINIKDYY